jgi:osmotically-inducible protein OsmY
MKRIAFAVAMVLTLGLVACTETQRNDTVITAEVKSNLTDSGLPDSIQVTTYDGMVTLDGTVSDAEARSKAQDIADDVDGVKMVQNNLRTTMAGDAPERPAPMHPHDNPPAPGSDEPLAP